MDAEHSLAEFMDRFAPDIAALAGAALAKMRVLLPGAIELVYDNYNALAIGFGPTEKTSEAPFSIAVYPRNVSLFFLQSGTALPDPEGILEGTGNRVRHIKLKSALDIDKPEVQALIVEALARVPRAFDPTQARRVVIKSVSKMQRSRRPSTPSITLSRGKKRR